MPNIVNIVKTDDSLSLLRQWFAVGLSFDKQNNKIQTYLSFARIFSAESSTSDYHLVAISQEQYNHDTTAHTYNAHLREHNTMWHTTMTSK